MAKIANQKRNSSATERKSGDGRVDAAKRHSTVQLNDPLEEGKGGKGGIQISNAEFIAAIVGEVAEGTSAAVCHKSNDPDVGGWTARRAGPSADRLDPEDNCYLNCSTFVSHPNSKLRARKSDFAACLFIMLDDIGTKVPFERLSDFTPSWMIETSPGNFQAGIILAEPLTDAGLAERLLEALIDAGLCDRGATGPLTRWARVPNAINGKAKYRDSEGEPFRCRLAEWHPEKRYTPDEIAEAFNIRLAEKKPTSHSKQHEGTLQGSNGVLFDKAYENPVIAALKRRGIYKTPLGSGKHDITCPWVHEHTDGLDTGAAYFEPSEKYPLGGFCCMHSHRDKYHIKELLAELGVNASLAQNKPLIRVDPGKLHHVVDAAEKVLADRGHHYQAGGLIVSVSTNPVTGDPSIVPITAQALTRELSWAAGWEKYDARSESYVTIDPPVRHVGILYDAQKFQYLRPLAGLARQPYFRETDGVLVREPGYDAASQLFGVFDPLQFPFSEPTLEAAETALALLEGLLSEFHFKEPSDKAAALSAIFTAAVRPTLAHAPAFHVRAPIFSSGKSYLCDVIGAFSGPGVNAKGSYPTTSEEASKVILSHLLSGTACVEFDDMDNDWLPHGIIKRMLTATSITERILGVSKTATVSTRTLFLGSGNNVGPIRDLLRRVITINLDPRCTTPATLIYKHDPLNEVRRHRGLYVAAVLTIILAWNKAGSPKTDVNNIATYGGLWSDYCRFPLMWLGQPDPVSSLLEQVRHDPDSEALGGLMREWHAMFGSTPTTVRRAVEEATKGFDTCGLLDAIREFPVEERGEINRSKLGWILKKNVNRIVEGLEFQRAEADGRIAWRVVPVK